MSNYSDDPGYDALRLGADWASAVRGNTVFFDYHDGQISITQPAHDPAPKGPVRVSTPPSTRARPRVTSITLTTAEYGHITLPSTSCSAALWSESAVEKFLLPYYASAAGKSAQAVLQAIGSAWYGYTTRPVCALTFQYSPAAMVGPLSLWNTVGVVFGTIGEDGIPVLRTLPLPEYLGKGPWLTTTTMTVPEIPRSTKPATPSGQATPIDSVGARDVAEYVNGLAGNQVLVYRSQEETGGLEPVLTSLPPHSGQSSAPLFTAQTSLVRPDRPRVSAELSVTVEAEEVEEVEVEVERVGAGVEVEVETKTVERPLAGSKKMSFPLTAIGGSPANDPDSAFWTDGAVEMLMLPYYASVKGYGAPWYLMTLLGKWAGTIPAAIVDVPELLPYVLGALERGLGTPAEMVRGYQDGMEGEPEPLTSSVFGLVHLPRSEYMDEGVPLESIALETRTWCLTPDRHHPLVSPRGRLVPPRPVTG
jgi:hypothetical protein